MPTSGEGQETSATGGEGEVGTPMRFTWARLPADPEFRSALVACLEWGTRIALANSRVDASVLEHAPGPRCGWGEAPLYAG
jgi:hypothetical protein